jgi:membrane protein YqaA with SNARE-associated domain
MGDAAAYSGLFFAAFLAATIFPAQSEAVLLGLIVTKSYPVWALITVASVGNVLGSVVNWWLGKYIEHFRDRKWFPVKQAALIKAQAWYSRYGRWSLLLSWVPIIGDPITVAAGVMRERLPIFLIFVTVGKISRYIAIAYIALK